MFFIITVVLLVAGVLLLRDQKTVAGYTLLVAGWAHAIFQNIATDKSWGAAITTFFLGIVFIWFVQKKMSANKMTKR